MLGHDTGTVSAILLVIWAISGTASAEFHVVHLWVQIELKLFED